MFLYCVLGILIPFVGTCIGSLFVYFFKNNVGIKCQIAMIGVAIGVMLAASIWSLIIPFIEMSDGYYFSWIPAVIGLILGVLFFILVNKMSDRLECKNSLNMLMFSVILHNIPEGMAVGVCFAGVLLGNTGISLLSAFVLAISIAIQNIPEGAIISIPLMLDGKSKFKSIFVGVLSGIVEPIASLITVLLLKVVVPILPYLLSFAAGAMIYVVIEELIPDMHSNDKQNIGIIYVVLGFIVMMILDVTLG